MSAVAYQTFEMFEAVYYHQMKDKQEYFHFEDIQIGDGRRFVYAKW